MAKIKITELSDHGSYTLGYGPDVRLGYHTGRMATFEEIDGGTDQVIIKGRNLAYDDNVLIGGTITLMIYANAEGKPYATISDVSFKAKFLGYDGDGNLQHQSLRTELTSGDLFIFGSNDVESLYGGAGRDRLSGLGGDDWMFGYGGKDIYTGGKGSDSFFVGVSQGDDIIMDFDASGGPGKQDRLFITEIEYEKRRSGDDTILEFEDGSSVRLLGVSPSKISDADFALFP